MCKARRIIIALLVLSIVSAFIVHYEFWTMLDAFKFDSSFPPVKSLVLKSLYDPESEGAGLYLGNAIANLMLVSFLINGACWLVCTWYSRKNKNISVVTFINAGILSGVSRCLRCLAEINFENEGLISQLQAKCVREGIIFSVCGLLCAVLWFIFLPRLTKLRRRE